MPAVSARFAITMTSAATITQPVIQPRCLPNARATQVKLVPQSGSTSLSARYAYEMNSMGTNASSKMIGALVPTSCATKPSVAERLYAVAVEATPITIVDTRPSAPTLRPLRTTSGMAPDGLVGVVVVIGSHP